MSSRLPTARATTRATVLATTALLALAGCGSDGSDNPAAVEYRSSAAPSSGTPVPATGSSSADTPSTDASSTSCDYVADPTGEAAREVDLPPATPDVSGTVDVTLDTSIGALNLSLDADTAPCTVNSFVSLVEQGYFDQTTCHRLTEPQTGISVLQCGDPTGTGRGGPGYTIPDELEGNTGNYPAGTLAMANTGAPHSGGSQFFIVYGPSTLGPLYTIFGTVGDNGVAAIQQVAQDGTDDSNQSGDGMPNTPVDITSAVVKSGS